MDLIVGYLSADPSIKGICLQDYQNKEEYVFTAFIKLACSAFNDLLKQNNETKVENQGLTEEVKKEKKQCLKLTKELDALKTKPKENSKCKKCITYEEDRFEFEQKYMKMEKQFKKCAFIINSSLDGDNKVLGRVRDIVSQSVIESNNSQDCNKVSSPEERLELQKQLSNSSFPIEMDDDDASILAPSSPEGSDMETQHFGGPGEDIVLCIPETVPFDYPQIKSNTQKFFKSQHVAPSPIIKRRKSPTKLSTKCFSPIKNKTVTPQKQSQEDSASLLDESIYSPPILTDFGFPSRPSAAFNASKPTAQELCLPIKTEALRPSVSKSRHSENINPQEMLKKPGHRSLAEQQTPTSKRNKLLKQTKLTLTRLPSDTASANGAKIRMPTKTVRISPPDNQEPKKRRRGKGPEEWPCKDCYQLFLVAVEAKKIDVRKMPVSMNFCAVHRNRYTYYLNTPPNFWDCGIGKPPRNGHLYPLDASATNDDDEEEDFLK
ncbi:hypothetical protein DAPPUDRAFT_300142 [Daphnia pulex]|uniref:Uncharacterized protein n=1 Tax=Daphnia pulex TaxID=6669 RepID=E9FR68_DAPPU|nr:hypothetical protein DAPPUDRAFT_300142 [Daphnia pulex]|eukprot:EFX90248.1 hypothetical protein DAPPUDRAFT_300142 [Daphnia pulex]